MASLTPSFRTMTKREEAFLRRLHKLSRNLGLKRIGESRWVITSRGSEVFKTTRLDSSVIRKLQAGDLRKRDLAKELREQDLRLEASRKRDLYNTIDSLTSEHLDRMTQTIKIQVPR